MSQPPSRQPPSLMSRDAFLARYGGVFEHAPWIAEAAFDAGLAGVEETAEGLHARLCAILRQTPRERQLALLRGHPELAGRLALAGELTGASTAEQASAGLDRCSPRDYARFQELNQAYRAKFEFPFIIAVSGRSREEILAAFERRLRRRPETEFATALAQVERIALIRLKSLFA